uniref:Uncharacterized protein n=1 Tax=Rhizophora mucronata TaxID=61149 RepID=A0A2P2QKB7_RHIMU
MKSTSSWIIKLAVEPKICYLGTTFRELHVIKEEENFLVSAYG